MKNILSKICICGKIGGVAGLLAWILCSYLFASGVGFWNTVLSITIMLIIMFEISALIVFRLTAPFLPLTIALIILTTTLLISLILFNAPQLVIYMMLGFLIGLVIGEFLCRLLSPGFMRYVSFMRR